MPWGALLCGGLGVTAIVRALYHPKRVVLDGARALHCAGESGCDPAMMLNGSGGGVYAMAPGTVIVGPGSVAIVGSDESVVLNYTGLDQVQVAAGQHVGIGQQIGLGQRVRFSVQALVPGEDGTTRVQQPYEPASWLAVHGLKPSGTGGSQWCDSSRQLNVPQQVAKCGIELPVPTAWALLPVRVSLSTA
jgi:hypothetical protein